MKFRDQLTQEELGYLSEKQLEALKEIENEWKEKNKVKKFEKPKLWSFRPKRV